MGKLLGAICMPHVMFPPDGVEEAAERVFAGMMEIRRIVERLNPTLIVMAAGDHFNNFDLAVQIPIGVVVADEMTSLADAGLPSQVFPGHREFAEGFVRFASKHDFEIVQIEEVRPDHGIAFPKTVVDPAGHIPIVPVYLNAVIPVPPSPARCHRLGQVLKGYVEDCRPADEKVLVIGTGGLSHWLRVPGEGRIAEDFDSHVIAALIDGDSARIAALPSEEIIAASGNGGLEIISWLFAAAAAEGGFGRKVFYEPIPAWVTGMGAIELLHLSDPD
ncbi:DODA-type extradiol aromatic ring-opening family dioxygenase [Novosphingobium aerophilum]|uniref:Protocatechuate 3,4-dioxygenase n=1 Tax=Novosphingobium aerophilum TaxID=2839843 RepID=A0A7X1KDU1_9SPHN|nr:protocatechuate 3,4-dioxygenase [Novosphingobium aerophilum]MBC2653512.1 protocatechuate 3,4-dioxygenase [Novosphingobium aerophilum]